MACIEPLMPLPRGEGVKLVTIVLGEAIEVRGIVAEASGLEPSGTRVFPLVQLFLRHGVRESAGDEVGNSGLPPAGKISTVDLPALSRPEI